MRGAVTGPVLVLHWKLRNRRKEDTCLWHLAADKLLRARCFGRTLFACLSVRTAVYYMCSNALLLICSC